MDDPEYSFNLFLYSIAISVVVIGGTRFGCDRQIDRYPMNWEVISTYHDIGKIETTLMDVGGDEP